MWLKMGLMVPQGSNSDLCAKVSVIYAEYELDGSEEKLSLLIGFSGSGRSANCPASKLFRKKYVSGGFGQGGSGTLKKDDILERIESLEGRVKELAASND